MNLLEGLTIAEGLTLQKVEIETGGVTVELAAPYTYTPDYPDPINLILTITKSDGNAIKERVEALIVMPLEYVVIELSIADVINEQYEWFNHILPEKQQMLYNDILVSYLS